MSSTLENQGFRGLAAENERFRWSLQIPLTKEE